MSTFGNKVPVCNVTFGQPKPKRLTNRELEEFNAAQGATIKRLQKEVGDLKLAEGLWTTGKKQLEDQVEDLKAGLGAANRMQVRTETFVAQLQTENEKLASEKDEHWKRVCEQRSRIRELEDRLKMEERRSGQCLVVADNASQGLGAVSSLVGKFNELIYRIESKLEK